METGRSELKVFGGNYYGFLGVKVHRAYTQLFTNSQK